MNSKTRILAIAGVSVALAAGLLGAIVALQPSHYEVERRVILPHPPEMVWPLVADYRAFVTWSPWEGRDPDQVTSFSEPTVGVGAWYAWEGNDDVGKGRMETLSADPPTSMEQRLTFIEPFASEATVRYDLIATADGTVVRWSMRGEHDLFSRVMSVFLPFDKLIGPDFERGLATLAVVADDRAQALAAEAPQPAPSSEPTGSNTTPPP